ncbi:MAG: hypothetical protein EOP50_06410 [Sphingobacteriales bacterium]|nr:MAG: hypothetical protein EOP50_06410 [Sphingobacteriales bacterium]
MPALQVNLLAYFCRITIFMIHRYFIKKVRERTGSQIFFGPFATLRIPEELFPHLTIGEMIGTYESCLHGVINELIVQRPQSVVIIGANNGYYCAGLAYTMRPQRLLAFEMVPRLHPIARSWWECNDLPPMDLQGEATPEVLRNIQAPVDLLICDCEGAEEELLQPEAYTWQKDASIIVELHDFYRPGLTQRLVERFSESHDIRLLQDDPQELELNDKILGAVHPSYWLTRFKIPLFPAHRWIQNGKHQMLTAGKFLYLCPKAKRASQS